jgi:hypothetical protein
MVQERKIRKRDLMPSVPQKMSPTTENMKMGPDTLFTIENGSGSVKYENRTRRSHYRLKRVRENKT